MPIGKLKIICVPCIGNFENTHTSQKFSNSRKQILLCAMLGIDISVLRTQQGAWPPLTDEGDMHQPGHQPWAPTLHKGCLVGLGSQAPNSTGTDIYLGCLLVPKVQLHQPGMATSPLPESCSTKGLRGGWDFNSSTGKHWRRTEGASRLVGAISEA